MDIPDVKEEAKLNEKFEQNIHDEKQNVDVEIHNVDPQQNTDKEQVSKHDRFTS